MIFGEAYTDEIAYASGDVDKRPFFSKTHARCDCEDGTKGFHQENFKGEEVRNYETGKNGFDSRLKVSLNIGCSGAETAYSGMPDPDAIYMTFPVGGDGLDSSAPFGFLSFSGAIAGRLVLVSIVALELTTPNTNAMPT